MSDSAARLVASLQALVARPSVSGSEPALAVELEAQVRNLGHALRRVPLPDGRWNLLVDTGGTGPAWLLLGHLDTVPPAAGWGGDAWTPRLAQGRMYGLGAWDMKAGLAAMLSCLADWRPGDPRVLFAFVVDEERDSEGVDALVESGGLQPAAAALVPEAAPGAQPGRLALTLGRPGRAGLRLTLRSEGGHGATPGSDCLLRGASLALALAELEGPAHPRLGPSWTFVRSMAAGAAGGLSRPDHCQLEIDCALGPGEDVAAALGRVSACARTLAGPCSVELGLRPRRGPHLLGYELASDAPLVARVESSLAGVGLGTLRRWDGSPADENRLAMAGIPVVSLSAQGDRAHAAGEWVDLASLGELARGLAAVLRRPPPSSPAEPHDGSTAAAAGPGPGS